MDWLLARAADWLLAATGLSGLVADTIASPWAWIIVGVALVGIEIVAPGAFMLPLGLAAVATGLVGFAVALPWPAQVLVFAALALGFVLVGRQLYGVRSEAATTPGLNRRGELLVGRVLTLDEAIVDGQGRVRIDDSVWRVRGADLPAGSRVRVARADGAVLVVEGAGTAG